MVGALDEADRLRASSLHLDLAPLSLQQLVVQAAGQPADTLERTTRMRTWRDVARYHLVVPWVILLIPWAILAVSFIVNLVIFSLAPVGHHDVLTSRGLVQVANAAHNYTGGVASIYILFFVIGMSIVGRSLPFALALGVSRRSYYAGTRGARGGAGGRRRARAGRRCRPSSGPPTAGACTCTSSRCRTSWPDRGT